MHKDARKSRNFREGESTETLRLNSAAQSKAKRRHFILCELSRLSLELNATHIHIFESVYKHARNITRRVLASAHVCVARRVRPGLHVFN